MLILGGIGRLSGAVLGAFVFSLLQLFFQWDAVFGNLCEALAAHDGRHHHRLRRVHARRAHRPARAVARVAAGSRRGDAARVTMPDAPPLLVADHVTRRFGGLTAVSDDLAAAAEGEIRGDRHQRRRQVDARQCARARSQPPAGGLTLLGTDVTTWSPARPCRPRSPATAHDLPRFTLAFGVPPDRAGVASSRPWHWWSAAAAPPGQHLRRATRSCRRVFRRRGRPYRRACCRTASGASRIAMCLATRPRVLLLDEPLAGAWARRRPSTCSRCSRASRRARDPAGRARHGRRVPCSDRITVMVNGAVIAAGTPSAVRADREVQLAYLGKFVG